MAFIKFINEAAEKHGVLAFGRMNPPTAGHEKVVNKVLEVAKEHKAGHRVVLSHTSGNAENPLPSETKLEHAKHAFPNANIISASKEAPTILHHAAQMYGSGVRHLHVVAGSDRQQEYHDLLHKYNTGEKLKHGSYKFKSITIHSSGARDPDAQGATGVSGTKMRSLAAAGNKKEFHAGLPTGMSAEHKEALYKDLRHHMGIKEVYDPHLKISEYQWGEKKGTDHMKKMTPGQSKIPYLLMTKEQKKSIIGEEVSNQLEFDGVQTKNFDMCPGAYKEFKQMIAEIRAGKLLGEPAGHSVPTDMTSNTDQVRQVQAGIAMKPTNLKQMQFKQYTGL